MDRVRNFLIRYLQCDSWAHDLSDLDKLFNAVSVAKLWNYDNYSPLEEVMKQMLPNDSTVKALMSEYLMATIQQQEYQISSSSPILKNQIRTLSSHWQ